MRNRRSNSGGTRALAAVLLDYGSACARLSSHTSGAEPVEDIVVELLDEIRKFLRDEYRADVVLCRAYADFASYGGSAQYVQQALYLHGADPRFVPATQHPKAAAQQLTIDAVDLLVTRPDVDVIVVVGGSDACLPLVSRVRGAGKQPIVVTIDTPPASEQVPAAHEHVFVPAAHLLGSATRERVFGRDDARPKSAPQPTTTRQPREGVHYEAVDEPAGLRALEIIEEHFGQYEEVYLTPLLRKLTELLDDDRYEPKTIINDLEEAGAVWLEKRRGFPYDYTVLLVDGDHPDVQRVQEAADEGDEEYPYDDDYPYDEYDDDEHDDFDDDFDEDEPDGDDDGEDDFDDLPDADRSDEDAPVAGDDEDARR